MTQEYDYIIVGSGAGGSAAAWRLVQTGHRVLLLEKGEPLPEDGSTLDVEQVFHNGRFKNHEPWRDGHGHTILPGEYFNLGGKTKWYGAALLRFDPEEFKADASHQFLAWPFGYETLAPYYDEAERMLGVRAFELEPDLKTIVGGVTGNGSGWTFSPLPLGLSPEILQYPDEAKHFDGFASVRGLKADAQRVFLEPVRADANLHVVTGANVATLLAPDDLPQRIIGVMTNDGTTYYARRVLLAAGAMHSPRLLERYLQTSGLVHRLPSARLVGRFYKRHLLTAMLAVSPRPKTDLLRKTVLLLNDRFPHSSVQTLGWMDGEIVGEQLPPFAPRWFANLLGRRAYGFWLTTEDGSHEQNRVRAQSDAADCPQLDYEPRRCEQAVREHRALVRDFRLRLLQHGLIGFSKEMPVEATAHACGTLVAGADPLSSVVDPYGKVHGLENLYVVDGSVLPRSSRVNPALTIYAWSLRVASLLANTELRRHP